MAPAKKGDEEAGQARAEQGTEDGGKAEQAGEVVDKPRGREKEVVLPAQPTLPYWGSSGRKQGFLKSPQIWHPECRSSEILLKSLHLISK